MPKLLEKILQDVVDDGCVLAWWQVVARDSTVVVRITWNKPNHHTSTQHSPEQHRPAPTAHPHLSRTQCDKEPGGNQSTQSTKHNLASNHSIINRGSHDLTEMGSQTDSNTLFIDGQLPKTAEQNIWQHFNKLKRIGNIHTQAYNNTEWNGETADEELQPECSTRYINSAADLRSVVSQPFLPSCVIHPSIRLLSTIINRSFISLTIK